MRAKKELKDVDGKPERGNIVSFKPISFLRPELRFELCEECYNKVLNTINPIFKEVRIHDNNKD